MTDLAMPARFLENPAMLTMPSNIPKVPAIARWTCMALVGVSLTACQTADRIVPTPAVSDDYRDLHPIELVRAPEILEIFPTGPYGDLDRHSAAQIKAFAASEADFALSPIRLYVPRGAGQGDGQASALVSAIRRQLIAGGARGFVDVRPYPVTDPRLAAPIRLSFIRIKAKVASQCGQWPRDLASASSIDGWGNRPYWNFGCATQNNFAAQVDDPRDLVGPRAEQPSDVAMRMRAIGNVRQGQDPGTSWKVKNSNLGSVGSD